MVTGLMEYPNVSNYFPCVIDSSIYQLFYSLVLTKPNPKP